MLSIQQEKALIAISKIQLKKKQKQTVDDLIALVENEGLNSGAAEFFISIIKENRGQVINPEMHIMALTNSVEQKVTGKKVGMSQVFFMIMVKHLDKKPFENLLIEANQYFGFNLLETTRVQNFVLGRQMLMKKLKDSGYGYTEIGKLLNKDHSTIIHGVRAITEKIGINSELKDKYLHYISL